MIKGSKSNNLIGFYAWYQFFDEMSINQQKEIISYIKDISKNIEENVNSKGGIAGKKIKIYIDIVYPNNTYKEHLIDFLKQNQDIIFIPSFPNYAEFKNDDINFNNYIQLDQFATPQDDDLPWNVFSTNEFDSGNIWDFVKSHFKEKNITLLINDGYVSKKNSKKEKYKKELKKRINKAQDENINYKVISNLHDDQSDFIDFINTLNKNDLIFLSLPSVMPLDYEDIINFEWIDIKTKILKTFTTNPSNSDLFLSHIDPREIYDCLNYEYVIHDKKIL